MRKYAVYSIRLVFTVASLIAVSSGCSKVQSQSPNSQTGQSSGQSSQSATGQSSQSSSSASGNQQTVEGCVVREHSTIYLQPASGDKVKLSSSDQDLSSQVGKDVRATGTMGSSGSSTSGSTGSTSSPSSAGTSGSADNADALVVTRVDVVDQTCPPDIQKRIDSDKQNRTNTPK